MLDRTAIPFQHWQMRTDMARVASAAALGEIVAGVDDLEQSIAAIVLTQKGSVPLEPLMCTDIVSFIDQPPALAIPNLCREIFDALTMWEPRIKVSQVKAVAASTSHWRFPIFWRPRADVLTDVKMTEVSYAR